MAEGRGVCGQGCLHHVDTSAPSVLQDVGDTCLPKDHRGSGDFCQNKTIRAFCEDLEGKRHVFTGDGDCRRCSSELNLDQEECKAGRECGGRAIFEVREGLLFYFIFLYKPLKVETQDIQNNMLSLVDQKDLILSRSLTSKFNPFDSVLRLLLEEAGSPCTGQCGAQPG